MRKNNEAGRFRVAFYKGNRLLFALALIFTLATVPGNLIASWILGRLIDLISAKDLGKLYRMLVFTVAFLAADAAVSVGMYRCKSRFIARAMRNYKSAAFDSLAKKSIGAFSGENTGRYLSVLTNDAASVEENYLNRTFLLIYHTLIFVGALVMMLVLSWKLGLVVVVLGVLPVMVSLKMGGGLTAREKDVSGENERFVSVVKDLLGAFQLSRASRRSPRRAGFLRRQTTGLRRQSAAGAGGRGSSPL